MKFRAGFYQFRPRFGEPESNCLRVVAALASVDADLIVLPELAFTGYLFSNRREARGMSEDPRKSAVVEALIALCRERGFYISTGFAERAGSRCFNSALLLGPRGILDVYRKIHLFNDEKRWFDPGDRALSVRRVRGVKVGTMICFDWAFPEAARTLALRGAQVIAHPSNLVLDYCQKTMLSRCLENAVFAVTCNRVGADERNGVRLAFTGRSQVVGPRGDLLAQGPRGRRRLEIVEIDPKESRNKKITPRNHLLLDRRPEFYA